MSEFQIGPLRLTVSGYAHPPSKDFYEANWLNIAVSCSTAQGEVAFQSACLMTTDIFDFMDEVEALLAGEGRQAYLVSLEPQVDVHIERSPGVDVFSLELELTPDVDNDEDIHAVRCEASLKDLEAIVKQAQQIIETFPVRGIAEG